MRITFTLREKAAGWLSRHLRSVLQDDTSEFDRLCRERALVARTDGSLSFSWPPEQFDAFVARLDVLSMAVLEQGPEANRNYDKHHRFIVRVVGYLKERKHRCERAAKRKQVKQARQRATGAVR